MEELYKKKKLTVKKALNQQGQEVLEVTQKVYNQATGEEMQPRIVQTGTREQIEAQKSDIEFLLSKF